MALIMLQVPENVDRANSTKPMLYAGAVFKQKFLK